MKHFQILIIGGGNAGISTASQLLRKDSSLQIAIADPAQKHYYQPAWTLVGGGVFDVQDTVRPQASVMPKNATWLRSRALAFAPDQNQVTLEEGVVSYDYLIVSPGIQINWNGIPGLAETINKNNVCSNYSFETAPYTYECLRNFKGGNAVFHNPTTPVKCGGAPHKVMYLSADYWRKHGILDKTRVQYWSGGTRIFGVEKYEKTLLKVVKRYHIDLHFRVEMTSIDGPNRKAWFKGIGPENKDQVSEVSFDMIHVTPPQSAPDFVRNSPLANSAGWVDVNKETLQHVRYSNIFSLGDAAGLPTAKTGAAVRKQVPVLVQNLTDLMAGKPLSAAYNGYSSCPLITGYGKLVLAEFDYNNKPLETFPFDQSQERWSMYMLKKEILPRMYWNAILPGLA